MLEHILVGSLIVVIAVLTVLMIIVIYACVRIGRVAHKMSRIQADLMREHRARLEAAALKQFPNSDVEVK